jgi:DNA-binding beta-propeller fold protein YncE
MSEDLSDQSPPAFVTPVSSFSGPIGELIAQHILSPPSRPGLLAILDRFEILRILGGGGMGLVLLGRDTADGREVAIKLMKSDLVANPQAAHRFVKEAGHLQRLRHPNVVPVLEVSDRPQGPYFVMPYFEKGSLAGEIQPGRPLAAERIVDIAIQIAEGLQFAHRRGIIHRDLKPANILLGADGQAYLGDFGLARTLFNDSVVDVGHSQCEGTAPYMSPAVAAGDAEDTRCDIYSFGALLYEMLTGEPPYKGTAKQIHQQILAVPPIPVETLNPKANRDLAEVVRSAMARQLRNRYADMADVLADLQRIKQGKPPEGPHGVRGRMRDRFLRIRRFRVTLTLSVGCIAAILAVVLVVRWVRSPPWGTLTFSSPGAVAVDKLGNRYVMNRGDYTISKITAMGFITDLAGKPGCLGITEGIGSNALFAIPRGIAADQEGNLFVADSCIIRKVTPDGRVELWAGQVGKPGSADGFATEAQFDLPSGLAVDEADNLYIADRYTMRRITPDCWVSTIAGTEGHAGNEDGAIRHARFSDREKGIAVDAAGDVYVADTFNHVIRKIARNGVTATLAGSGKPGSADGTGNKASFYKPSGVAVDHAGNVYVADTGNHTIRKITPAGDVTTLAGRAGYRGEADGLATNALFSEPQGIAVDVATGNIYVVDTGNGRIREITPAGRVTSLQGVLGQVAGARFLPTNALPGGIAGSAQDVEPALINLPHGVEECVKLARNHVREDVILAKVRRDGASYNLTYEQIVCLESNKVPENVIKALLVGK